MSMAIQHSYCQPRVLQFPLTGINNVQRNFCGQCQQHIKWVVVSKITNKLQIYLIILKLCKAHRGLSKILFYSLHTQEVQELQIVWEWSFIHKINQDRCFGNCLRPFKRDKLHRPSKVPFSSIKCSILDKICHSSFVQRQIH